MSIYPPATPPPAACPVSPSTVKNAVQLQNIVDSVKIKGTRMPEGDAITFMKFVSASLLVIVTASAVYSWDASDASTAPTKVCDRHASLGGAQVIDAAASADAKWIMIAGLKPASGTATGAMQLYSVDNAKSQPLPAYAGCFCSVTPEGAAAPVTAFAFVQAPAGGAPKFQVIELGAAAGAGFRTAPVDLPFAADATGDFPVSLVASNSGIAYVVTKMGFVFVHDVLSGSVIFRHRVSSEPLFTAVAHAASGGALTIAVQSGQVSLLTLNAANVVPYVSTTLRKPDLAMKLAGRLGLPGADNLYKDQFEAAMTSGNIEQAATVAVNSPKGVLRSEETLNRLKALPTPAGGQPPLMKYVATVMRTTTLNSVESVEVGRMAIQQGRLQLLEKWLKEGKITCSEALGDMASPYDAKLALAVYLRAGNAHEKVVAALAQGGHYDKIVPYCQQHNFAPNYASILHSLVHSAPDKAQEFATKLVKADGGPLIAKEAAADIFMQFNRLKECTGFLLDVLAEDKPEEAMLQTRLLEMNLLGGAPQVVEAILSSDMLHQFDKKRVAVLCEKSGLLVRALQLFDSMDDIKRVLSRAPSINQDQLATFLGTLTPENAQECLRLLLQNRQNEALVVKVATQFAPQLGAENLIHMFEEADSINGLYYFLAAIVRTSEDKEVHYKYIVAAAKLKQFSEVERMCKESNFYDPEEVKNFLIMEQLQDPRPLIHVCDRHGFVAELTEYLHKQGMAKFIEVYVSKVSPSKAPEVVGKLLDLDADEDFIKELLFMVRHSCPVAQLVEAVETRNRLRLLQGWLEAKISEGNTEAATHNAIGKIYVAMNKEPQEFLANNQFYEPMVLGQYCEKMDPYLAFLAYKRAAGACDEQLLDVTSEHGLWKDQARYLVERQSEELWARQLSEDNPHRQRLVDQVTSTALPETKDPDAVSATVKAFMAANMPAQLLDLLEKLVLNGGEFADNKNLQNLLILTAVRCSNRPDARPGRAMEYIQRLDNYDGAEIARIAVREEYQLYEEAFEIYKKCDMPEEALDVLIEHMENLDRAAEYAERVNKPAAWSKLAGALLEAGRCKEAVDAYVKSKDASNFERVIAVASDMGAWEDLVTYLRMARQHKKERRIDSELLYALARAGALDELEVLLTSPNVADIQAVGDRVFEEGSYEAARILFEKSNNNAKLATALLALGRLRDALAAAKKANSVRTWRQVNAACLQAHEFKLAQAAGLHIISSPDHLEELVASYERGGHFEELLDLLEMGVASADHAHPGVYTELCVQYSRHREDKLLGHIKQNWQRMNHSRVLRACETARCWREAAWLYNATDEFDSAVRVMIEHSAVAFELEPFLEQVRKVKNGEVMYNAVLFFLEEEPSSLNRLLDTLTERIDAARVVHLLRKREDALPLILPWLKSVQKQNKTVVNDAVNDIAIEAEDAEALHASLTTYDAFDVLDYAKRLEKHELLQFRRIAAELYRRHKRWQISMQLSMRDGVYNDAIDTAAASEDCALVEELLRFFVQKEDKECFAAALYTCYSFVPPDVALELAWRAGINDYAMPYAIQYVADLHARVGALEAASKKGSGRGGGESEAQAAAAAAAFGLQGPGGHMMLANEAYNTGMASQPPPPALGGAQPPQQHQQQVAAPQQAGLQAPLPQTYGGPVDVFTMHGATA